MDLNLLGNVARAATRPAAAGDTRAAVGVARVALSLQALVPLIESQGGQTQFARDLRALVADAARGPGTVFVVQPAGSGALRIEIGRQFLTVPPTLRDAVMALIEAASRSTRAAAGAAPPAPLAGASTAPAALTAGAIAWAQSWAAGALAGSQAAVAAASPRVVRAASASNETRASTPTVDADVVLLDEAAINAATSTASGASRLRSAVETSGLFFESHLAQWSAGARSADEMRGELARLQRQAATEHADDGAAVRTHAAGVSGERVAAQLEVLHRSAFALNAMAWAGQPCTIEFRKETSPDRDARGAAPNDPGTVVAATLTLDLPRFGPLQVRLRLAGSSVAVTASTTAATTSGSRARLVASMQVLGGALQARGLNPAALLVDDAT